ncbi:hypothetical protein CRK81_19505 [Salmonella enterica subsp. enterica serovar Poona]|nr:hypothetical protein [Salmonella enterica subsp. enterica serovar Poona]
MSKLTPAFKCCNEMTLISSWPESYPYAAGMPEIVLLTRIFDVAACQYAQQFAQSYKAITGYDLPFTTLADDEIAAIRDACTRFIADTEELKKVAQKEVDKAKKHISDIRSGVIRSDERYPLKAMLDDAEMRLFNEEKRRDGIHEKLDKKIRVLKTVVNVKHDDDLSHIINISLRDFSGNVSTRVNCYKSMFAALQRITSLSNEMRVKIEAGSVILRRSNTEGEFINEQIDKVTRDYYRGDNEALRNSLTLAEYTELRLSKIKEDARIDTVIKLGLNEPVID